MSVPPVQNSNAQTTSGAAETDQVARQVPQGIAAGQTTMQSAASPNQELGYVESAVQWLAGWIGWLFKTIFCCFFTNEKSVEGQQIKPPPVPPGSVEGKTTTPQKTEESDNSVKKAPTGQTATPSHNAQTQEKGEESNDSVKKAPTEQAPPFDPLKELSPKIREKADLMQRFDQLPEQAKKLIYRKIGKKKGSWLFSYESVGKSEVDKDPLILKGYLNQDKKS